MATAVKGHPDIVLVGTVLQRTMNAVLAPYCEEAQVVILRNPDRIWIEDGQLKIRPVKMVLSRGYYVEREGDMVLCCYDARNMVKAVVGYLAGKLSDIQMNTIEATEGSLDEE